MRFVRGCNLIKEKKGIPWWKIMDIKNAIPAQKRAENFRRRSQREVITQEIEEQRIRMSTYIQTYALPPSDKFIKMFRENIIDKKGKPVKLGQFSWFAFGLMPYANKHQVVQLTSTTKKVLSKECGKTEKVIMDTVLKMVDCDVMIRIREGHYLFNPFLFASGADSRIQENRTKLLYCVEHNCIDKYEEIWYDNDTKIAYEKES